MSIALAQSFLGGNGNTTNTTPFTLNTSATFPSNVAAGSLILVHGAANVTASTLGNREIPTMQPAVPGAAQSDWVQTAQTAINIASPISARGNYLYYLQNCPAISAGSTISVPWIFAGSGVTHTITAEFAVYVFTGVLTAGNKFTVQETNHNNTGTASTPSTANLVIANTDLCVCSFVGDSGNLSAGTGYTPGINMSVATFGSLQYILNQASGSIATAFSGGTEANWAASAAAFKPAPPAKGFSFGSILGA